MESNDTLRFAGTCTKDIRREQVTPNAVRTTETFIRFKAEVARPKEGHEEREVACPVCGSVLIVKVASAAATKTRFVTRVAAAIALAALAALYVTSCVQLGFRPGEHLGTMAWEAFLAFASGLGALLVFVTCRDAVWLVGHRRVSGSLGHTVSVLPRARRADSPSWQV